MMELIGSIIIYSIIQSTSLMIQATIQATILFQRQQTLAVEKIMFL